MKLETPVLAHLIASSNEQGVGFITLPPFERPRKPDWLAVPDHCLGHLVVQDPFSAQLFPGDGGLNVKGSKKHK